MKATRGVSEEHISEKKEVLILIDNKIITLLSFRIQLFLL